MEEEDQKLLRFGFEVFRDGPRPVYKTPKPQSRRLHKISEVKAYLEAQHLQGRLLDVSADLFSFGKRKERQEGVDQVDAQKQGVQVGGHQHEGDAQQAGGDEVGDELSSVIDSMVRLLRREQGVTTNHRQDEQINTKFIDFIS